MLILCRFKEAVLSSRVVVEIVITWAAYEYYGNQAVIAGNQTNGENPILINFIPGQNYNANDTVSIILDGGTWLTPSVVHSGGNIYCLYNGSSVVATQTSLSNGTLFLQFNSNVTAGTNLSLQGM